MKIEIKERIEKIKNKEVPEGYRKIGDGVYPIDWTKVKMEEIFNRVNNPVLVEKDKLYQEIGIRSHGKGIFHKEHKLGVELGNKRVFWIEPDVFIVNIVFAWEQAIAKTTEKELGMIASHRFPMYKPVKDILDLEYITYYFKTKRGKEKLELASPGGAGRNKTLGQKEFDRLEIVLPTIREQEKISTILSKWDEGILKQEKLIEAKKKYKKGMMQKIFSQELRFKDENGNDYPEWQIKIMENIAKISMGFTPSTNNDDMWEGDYKWLSIGDLKENRKYISYTSKFITEKAIKNKKILKKGTLIMSFKLTLGKVGILAEDMFTNEAICSFKWKNDNINTNYIYYYLDFINIKSFGSRAVMGITLNSESLNSIVVKLPSFPEQEKIANFLSSIDREIELLEKELSILKNEKQSLMSMLLNGIIRTD